MVKRLIGVALSFIFLLSSVFFCTDFSTASAQDGPGYVSFFLRAPNETLDADTFEISVCADIPEGVAVGGMQLVLSYTTRFFSCSKSSVTVNSEVGTVDDNIRFVPDGIVFFYDDINTVLTSGTHTLYTVEFAISEYTPEGEYSFSTYINELFDNSVEMVDLIPLNDKADIYIGERFEVIPSTATMFVGESLSVFYNKPINYVDVVSDDILSYDDGVITALSEGTGVISFSAETGETFSVIIRVYEPNASLRTLTVSNATLTPAFNPESYHYSATVPYAVERLNLNYTTADSNAMVQVNNPILTAGGVTEVTITVTAPDGVTKNIYTISVTRDAPSTNCNLSSLSATNATLSPAFQAGVYNYTASVPYTVDRLNVNYTAADNTATVKVNNPTLTAGSVTKVTVTVTAQSGAQKVYTISVTRAKPPYPDKITSGRYTIGSSTISKIPAGTTVATLLAGINERQYVTVCRANGASASTGEVIGTGFTVRLMHGSTIKQILTVVVTGDVNGDGKITASDYVNVKFVVLGKSKLSGVYSTAADINGDGEITATDYVNIKFHVLGKTAINPR